MQYNAEELLKRLFKYYNVHTISELSKILNIGQPAISKWKINNSVNTIKKKCHELGIYDEIFDTEIIGNTVDVKQKSLYSSDVSIDELDYVELFKIAYSFAKRNGKLDELKSVLKSYI